MTREPAWVGPLFCLLTFLFTWSLLPFADTSIPISLVALCGPAVAAFATAALIGRAALGDLADRLAQWRVAPGWYVLALLLPLPVSAMAAGLEYLAGARGPIALQPILALNLVVFVLVAGEEIGWRGFALPRLLARFGSWRSSFLLGLVWALWHVPLFFIPGMPQHGSPIPAFALYTVALSVILTFLVQRTGGSLIIATLFHGAVNTFGFVNGAADVVLRGWGMAIAYAVVALALGLAAWNRPGRASSATSTSAAHG
jgi:membrane protease YdiL (CAAX protease family)